MKWDALPPTLVLTCEKSDWEGHVGKTQEVKVVRLDEEALHWGSEGKTDARFKRAKAGDE